jgi:hypothetical protein
VAYPAGKLKVPTSRRPAAGSLGPGVTDSPFHFIQGELIPPTVNYLEVYCRVVGWGSEWGRVHHTGDLSMWEPQVRCFAVSPRGLPATDHARLHHAAPLRR